jgi:hypothetical protein
MPPHSAGRIPPVDSAIHTTYNAGKGVRHVRPYRENSRFRDSIISIWGTFMETDTPAAAPKRKLRWYQYSLRTLLILVTLFAVACSWFAVKMKEAGEQKEARMALLRLGGDVRCDCDLNGCGDGYLSGPTKEIWAPKWMQNVLGLDFFSNVIFIVLRDAEIKDADLKHFQNMKHLQTLCLNGSNNTDAILKHIKTLDQVEYLDLNQTPTTDAGLKYISGLKKLRRLFLAGTKITDAGLAQLEGMSQLQFLLLEQTDITDDDLKYLESLKELRWLSLDNTQITDDGLKHLASLTELRVLYLTHTQVTDNGIADLQKALPKCKIERQMN